MASFRKVLSCVLLTSAIWTVDGDSTFAGSSVSSGPGGSRSVLVTGRNGAGGVVQSRFGGGSAGVSSGSGPVGTFASAGGASAYAGPGGAYAGPGGSPWGFPYWNNGGGAYASAGAGAPYPSYDYPQPYPYDPYAYGGTYGGGNTGVYSGSDSNGIQTRFANVGPGGQATIVEQNGDEPPRVYTYKSATKDVEKIEP